MYISSHCIHKQCKTINSHAKSKKKFQRIFYFRKFHFFFKILSYFILFYFIFLKKIRKNFLMNSVHEQCPISDSETVLSQKLAKCTMCTATAQPALTGRAQAASAWPYLGQPSVVSWLRPWSCRRPGLPCHCASRHTSCLCPPCRVPSFPACTVSWTQWLYRGLASWPCRDTKPNSLKSLLVTIQSGILRYKTCSLAPLPITIHIGVLQYNSLSS